MKRYFINEEFLHLKSFVLNLPSTFYKSGSVMINKRNILKKVDFKDKTVVVKYFKGMYFFNKLAYSFFAKSKAEKSYLNSRILNDKGIATPEHIAWMDCYKWGILSGSYYVCAFSPSKTLLETVAQLSEDPKTKSVLFRDLATFALKLHKLNIYHKDFSAGNILVTRKNDHFDFSLIDLNRVKVRKVSFDQGVKNFSRLSLSSEDIAAVISEYALLNNGEPESTIKMLEEYNKRRSYVRGIRRSIRKQTLGRIEQLMSQSSPSR